MARSQPKRCCSPPERSLTLLQALTPWSTIMFCLANLCASISTLVVIYGLLRARFTILQRDYLDLRELELFLDRCKSIGLGEAKRGVVTQMFAKQHGRRDKKYRWGNCMLGWSFRGGNKYEQPTLTMHSRVSYIAYIGGADLALCYVLAREIGTQDWTEAI
jgi:hypothetical protein